MTDWVEHREVLEDMSDRGGILGLSAHEREAIKAALTRIDHLHETVRELRIQLQSTNTTETT